MSAVQVTHVYKVIGNLSLTVDVSLPPNFSKENGILVLHFHGGFLVIGEKTTFPPHWLINACHTRNWAYATASYRLLPESSGSDILSDALDVTRWIYNHVTTNLILAGSSAGAYLAFATAALPQSPPVLSVLSIYGMLDFTRSRYLQPGRGIGVSVPNVAEELRSIDAAMETGDPIDGYAFPKDLAADRRFRWISTLHESARIPDTLARIPELSARLNTLGLDVIPESHRALFPVTFGINASFPPLALIHGDQDDLVDVEQSVRASEKIKQYGTKVLLEVVEGQGHGFDCKEAFDIDTDVATDMELYPSLRRVIAFLEETVASGKSISY